MIDLFPRRHKQVRLGSIRNGYATVSSYVHFLDGWRQHEVEFVVGKGDVMKLSMEQNGDQISVNQRRMLASTVHEGTYNTSRADIFANAVGEIVTCSPWTHCGAAASELSRKGSPVSQIMRA